MKQTTIITVVLAVLVLASFVQAVQLNGLQKKIADNDFSISSASGKVATANAPSSGAPRTGGLPANLNDLPTMVGGC